MGWLDIFKKVDVQKTFDTVASGIDKTFYTKEEKADMMKKLTELDFERLKLMYSENTTRSITRRWIAIFIMALYSILTISGIIVFGLGNTELATFIKDLLLGDLGTAFISIIIFFFGNYVINNLIDKKKKVK